MHQPHCPAHPDELLQIWTTGHSWGWGPSPARVQTEHFACIASGCKFVVEFERIPRVNVLFSMERASGIPGQTRIGG